MTPNAERNAEIVRRRKAGQLPRQIAAEMGLSKNVVIGVTNRAGLSQSGLQTRCVLRGADTPWSKLTQEQVDEIRRQYVPRHPEFGAVALARRYGVTPACVAGFLWGNNWKRAA